MIDVSKMFARNGEAGMPASAPAERSERTDTLNVPTITSPNLCHRSMPRPDGSRRCVDNYADTIQITEMIGARKDMCKCASLLAYRSRLRSIDVGEMNRGTYERIITPISTR